MVFGEVDEEGDQPGDDCHDDREREYLIEEYKEVFH